MWTLILALLWASPAEPTTRPSNWPAEATIAELGALLQEESKRLVQVPPGKRDFKIRFDTTPAPRSQKILEAVLELHGFYVHEVTLSDGLEVTRIDSSKSSDSRTLVGRRKRDKRAEPKDRITLILPVRHLDLNLAHVTALELGRKRHRTLGASRPIEIASVPPEGCLLLLGEPDNLRRVRVLIETLDVVELGRPPVLECIGLRNIAVTELPQRLAELLGVASLVVGNPAPSADQRAAFEREVLAVDGKYLRLLCDGTTQRVVLDGNVGFQVEFLAQLIRELDSPKKVVRENTHVYRSVALSPSILARELRREREGMSNDPTLRRRYIAHDSTGLLIVQALPKDYERVLEKLRQIDQ